MVALLVFASSLLFLFPTAFRLRIITEIITLCRLVLARITTAKIESKVTCDKNTVENWSSVTDTVSAGVQHPKHVPSTVCATKFRQQHATKFRQQQL